MWLQEIVRNAGKEEILSFGGENKCIQGEKERELEWFMFSQGRERERRLSKKITNKSEREKECEEIQNNIFITFCRKINKEQDRFTSASKDLSKQKYTI